MKIDEVVRELNKIEALYDGPRDYLTSTYIDFWPDGCGAITSDLDMVTSIEEHFSPTGQSLSVALAKLKERVIDYNKGRQ